MALTLWSSVCIAFLLGVTGSMAQGCLIDGLPIDEEVLLNVGDRWELDKLGQPERDSILQLFRFVDSTGAILTGYDVFGLDECQLFDDEPDGITVSLFEIQNQTEVEREDRDESIYVATSRDGSHIDHLCIGQLSTTCSLTYLRGSFIDEAGTIEMRSLEHEFDCESAEFVKTKQLETLRFVLRDDGRFVQNLNNDVQPNDGE